MIRVRVTVNGKVEREIDVDRELTVGRKAPADVVIADGQVSSRHLALRPDGARLLVRDLGSTNGTTIDGGERLAANADVPFERGRKLLVGPAVLEIVASGDGDSSSGFGRTEKTVAVGRGAMQDLLVQIARFKAAEPRLVLGAEHARRSVPISEMEVVVGRDSGEAQVVVPHQSVSSRHARIRCADGRFVIEDLGSANGTFVGGVRIAAATPLEPQTDVTLGTVECLFVAKAPESGGAEGAADRFADALARHAVRLGKATEAQTREALAEHRSTGRTLGEIFVEKGLFGPREWAEVWRQRSLLVTLGDAAPSARPTASRMFGIVVVVLGLVALAVVGWTLGWFGGAPR